MKEKRIFFTRFFWLVRHLPICLVATLVVLVIRLIRPWCLIRFEYLFSSRIGHLAANVELYLCERNAGINMPKNRYFIDFFYPQPWMPICNKYLLSMWKRSLNILPCAPLVLVRKINRLFPGWKIHEIGQNTQNDRDVHNLFMRYPVHLKFTKEEEEKGARNLEDMGVPQGKPFVCLLVRDSAYLKKHLSENCSGHDYRDVDIDNYILATEELVKRGYYVIRMGAIVRKPLKVDHPNVIDYAWTGIRSEFMDIYLGATCDFCISTHSGWDAIPNIFRKPIVFTNLVPLGGMFTFRKNLLTISKRYKDKNQRERNLSLKEIFNNEIGSLSSTSDYSERGVALFENTPEEIRDVVIEMVERLNNTWQTTEEDEELQARFWEIFPTKTVDHRGHPHHGKIYSRFGASYLRNNKGWLT